MIAILLLTGLLAGTTAGAAAARWTTDETPEQRYWKKLHEKEAKQAQSEEQQRLEARENALADLVATLEAGEAFQPQVLIEINGPPPPPPRPSVFAGKRDYIVLGAVGVFVFLLTYFTLVRHKREAEIRTLSGPYLSDGTEAAHRKLPAWFAAFESGEGGFKEDTGLSANASSRDYVLPDAVTQFFRHAPELMAEIREVLKKLFLELDPAERQKNLEGMRELLSALQARANYWHLRPAWQMTSALVLLVTRAIEKPKDATPSVIKTIASALDTLQELCAPNVRPNLLLEPSIRILAVDDEPLCRRALQFALQKANLTADVAESGEKAVQFAWNVSYDVVLMDIQMPGIDGLTACKRILQTERNSDVPVIFVTAQSDFGTRAKTRLEGGADLMAKPYLILELTVKAVTFAARKRLHVAGCGRAETVVSRTPEPMVQVFPNDSSPAARPPFAFEQAASERAAQSEIPALKESDLEGDFFIEISDFLRVAHQLLDNIRAEPAAPDVEAKMGHLYLRIHKVAIQAALQDLTVTEHIGSTLEALLKRLYNNPKAITLSTLNTAANALRLLTRICVPFLERRLSDFPAVKLLVVEDEPLARRAIAGALQLAFEKPDSAGDGASALRLASGRPYDVIFTDVQMPEMDGFTLCTELRAGETNRATPVVFITSLNHIEAQARALESGGNDFIAKPFLPIEITVKAMTLAWENRLRNLHTKPGPDSAAPHSDEPSTTSSPVPPTLAAIDA